MTKSNPDALLYFPVTIGGNSHKSIWREVHKKVPDIIDAENTVLPSISLSKEPCRRKNDLI